MQAESKEKSTPGRAEEGTVLRIAFLTENTVGKSLPPL